jgi:hypothetical protein
MNLKKKSLQDNIEIILNDSPKVTQIIQSGIHEALLKHKQDGQKICVFRDNKVTWIAFKDKADNK